MSTSAGAVHSYPHVDLAFGGQVLTRTADIEFSPFSQSEQRDAIWVICQLLMKRRSSGILDHIPVKAAGNVKINSRSRIELLSLINRQFFVSASNWLLSDWPERFVSTLSNAGITLKDFGALVHTAPKFMSHQIALQLTKRRHGAVHLDALNRLLSENLISEKHVSKKAIKAHFGVSESKVIDKILMQRREGSWDELCLLIKILDEILLVTSERRAQRSSCIRDYSCFLFSVLFGLKINQVCQLSVTEARQKLISLEASNESRIRLLGEKFAALNNIYLVEIRPSFLVDSRFEEVWLVSRFGFPIKGHGVRIRITSAMGIGFEKMLWKSADVFVHTLHRSRMGRRAKVIFG